ncbi:MAG: hypothetical protein GY862_20555 [Gammaproteobacteria bacterium]|nr:hypothetical protein [Gammaproteobacteria bacterium]
MEIRSDDYSVIYDAKTATISCTGSFLLSGTEEYAPILELLLSAVRDESDLLSLDLRDLEFLNSSGINTLTKFVINIRNQSTSQLVVHGHQGIPWQVRLLKNLQRLMPALQMKLE